MTRIFQKKYLIYWIMALAVVARVIALGKSFQGDEFFSIMDAKSLALIPDVLLSDTHPPLYFYILHFFMKISMQEAFLRILSIIPGLGICFLTYFIGREFLDEVSGWVGALIVALAPIAVWASQYVRTYSLAAFFTVFSVYFLARVLTREDKDLKDWIGYVACSALSIYTFYFSALIILAENVYVLLFARKKQFVTKWILAQAAIVIAYIPWIPYFIFQRSSYVGHPQMVEKIGFYIGNIHVGGIIRSAAGLFGFDPRLFSKDVMSSYGLLRVGSIILGIAIFALIVWIIFRSRQAQKPPSTVILRPTCPERSRGKAEESIKVAAFFPTLLLYLALVPFFIALILHQLFGIILMSHYFIASFVFLVLFFVFIITKSFPKRGQVIILAVCLVLYSGRLFGMYMDKEMDFKGAGPYVAGLMADNAAFVAPSFGGPIDFYFPGIEHKYYLEDPKTLLVDNGKIVYISCPKKLELKELDKRFRRSLDSKQYHLKSSKAFGDLLVERFERP